jgi:hypothetical protein
LESSRSESLPSHRFSEWSGTHHERASALTPKNVAKSSEAPRRVGRSGFRRVVLSTRSRRGDTSTFQALLARVEGQARRGWHLCVSLRTRYQVDRARVTCSRSLVVLRPEVPRRLTFLEILAIRYSGFHRGPDEQRLVNPSKIIIDVEESGRVRMIRHFL